MIYLLDCFHFRQIFCELASGKVPGEIEPLGETHHATAGRVALRPGRRSPMPMHGAGRGGISDEEDPLPVRAPGGMQVCRAAPEPPLPAPEARGGLWRFAPLPAGSGPNTFGFDDKLQDAKFAHGVIQETHDLWKAAFKKTDHSLSLDNITLESHRINESDAKAAAKL